MTTSSVAPPAPAQTPGDPLDGMVPRKKKVSGGELTWRGIRMALLIFFAAVILMPIYVVIVTSFKAPADFSVTGAWNLPERLSFNGWAAAWEALAPALVRSVILAVSSAVFASILGSMNGFVFAKWKFPGADVIYGIPICTLIFRNYYATAVPTDIIEAARVDGAGMWGIFTKIVLPVSAPAFVVTMIWQFTSAWNDFLFALFLTDRNTGPVTYALQKLASAQNPDYSRMMAGVLVASLPTLLVYIFLGRYFVSGLMSGSVK